MDLVASQGDHLAKLGLIQPHGLLAVIERESLLIEAISENSLTLLGLRAEDLVGRPLAAIIDECDIDDFSAGLRRSELGVPNPYEVVLRGPGGRRRHTACTVHRMRDDRRIVEFEPGQAGAESVPVRDAAPVERIAAARDIPTLLENVARDVQAISGFDRVLVHRIEPDRRFTVVADTSLEPGSREPLRRSSPPEAVAFESRFNPAVPLRLIVDLSAAPCAVLGAAEAPSATTIDLSRAALWSPTANELAKLDCIGSRALLQIAIVVRGRLWGLVSGYHGRPRRLGSRRRSRCELLVHLLGWQLDARLEKEAAAERVRTAVLPSVIGAALNGTDDGAAAAIAAAPAILDLFDADSITVRLNGVVRRSAGAPADDEALAGLTARLDARAADGIASAHDPDGLLPSDGSPDAPVSALYLQVTPDGKDFALILRGRGSAAAAEPDSATLAAARALRELLAARIRAREARRTHQFTNVDVYLDARSTQTAALLQLHADVAAAVPSRTAIVDVILEFIVRETHADGGVLEQLRESEIFHEAATGTLAPYAGAQVARAGSISGLCVDLDAALRCDDTEHDVEPVERDVCRRWGVASMVVVPVALGGGATVVLKVVSGRRAAFGDEDIQTLKLAATSLSTALRAAQEFDALARTEEDRRKYAQQLRTLHAIATTTTSNRHDQIDAALHLGLDQLDLDWGFCGVVDHRSGEIIVENSVSRGGPLVIDSGVRVSIGQTFIGRAADSKGIQIIADVANLPRPPVFTGWTSYIAVPLFIDGANYGVIGFTSRELRRPPFSEADVEFVAMAGELIASAVERGRQREALLASEMRYRALSEATPEMLWVVDAANRFEYVNPRWTAYTGLTLEQSRVRGCAAVYDAAQLAFVDEKHRAIPPAEYQCEIRLRRHDGTYRWHLMRCVPFHGSAGEWLVSATDIEDRKSAEALMTDVHDAALAATEAKSRFLATMSHEIRTPMNAVIGMTELLLLTQLSEEQREYLEIVRNSGQSLLRVLNDILDYSKIEAGKLELETVHFDLPGQIESVVELLRAQYQIKGVKLTTRIRRDVPTLVAGDPGRLRQILLNLVGNALKFTPEGGNVHINISPTDEERDATGALPIRFSVEDTGIGIPPEIVERLFQPFSQGDESTTRKYGGTGLGLSICAQLVALMNGHIGVRSAPGAGSTFWFTIPLHAAKHQHKSADPRKRGTAARNKPVIMRAEKILLVEDNEINTFLALKQLQRIGFTVSAVNNGRQAVDAVSRERFDLVFMDCHMPEMDGFAATREIRRLEAGGARRLPIVAITADARTEDHQNCLRAGMDDYVSKPTSLESLRAVLDRWLPSPDRRQNNRNGAPRPNPAPTLRVAKLLEIFGGDRGAVITLLTAAAGAIKADFARIENCSATGDFASVAEAAHRLKGTSASIRSPRLGEISVAVERAALAADVSDILVDELREAVDTLVADVEKHGKLLATIG